MKLSFWRAASARFLGSVPLIARLCVLGLLAGAVAVVFQSLVHFVFERTLVKFSAWSFSSFALTALVVMSLANLASQWIMRRFAPEASGSGVPQTKAAYWIDFGWIPFRVVWVKLLAGILAIGGGLSLGREGPSVQIGAAVCSSLAGWFGVAKQKRRDYCAAGASAGLAAAFNTPLAAITFVIEEMLGSVSSKVLGGVVLAAVMGAFAVLGLRGPFPAFQIPEVGQPGWLGFLLVPLVAFLSTWVAIGFQRGVLALRGVCRRAGDSLWWVRALAGAWGCWFLSVGVFYVTGRLGVFSLGYEDLSQAVVGEMLWSAALLLLVGKVLATMVCYGTGGCGGIFAPGLFFGAMCGTLMADGVSAWWGPLPLGDRQALVLAGMSASLMALVRAPLTSILILFEMTRNFAVVPGLMLAVLVAKAVTTTWQPRGFYEALLEQDGVQLQHLMGPSDLSRWREIPLMLVAGLAPVTVNLDDPESMRRILAETSYRRMPVCRGGRVIGVATRPALEMAVAKGTEPTWRRALWISSHAKVGDAEALLVQSDLDFLCVGDENSGRLDGVLTLHDLLRVRLEE